MSAAERLLDRLSKEARSVPRASQKRRKGLRDDVAAILNKRTLRLRNGSRWPSGVRGAVTAIILRYAECVAATPVTLTRGEWQKLGALPQPIHTVSDLWDALFRAGEGKLQARLQVMPPVAWMVVLDVLTQRAALAGRVDSPRGSKILAQQRQRA